jgi:hypothetical protein
VLVLSESPAGDEQVDRVLAALVDESRDRSSPQVIETATDEWKPD